MPYPRSAPPRSASPYEDAAEKALLRMIDGKAITHDEDHHAGN